ncbi:MAG: glycosyltransferase [Nitrospirae bacterium]|nr:glycosyltransferase [Nitrospirota bacterium]
MRNERVSVIVPCFNEGMTISGNVKRIHNYLTANFADFEIIAVDDGSKDNTVSELSLVQKEVPLVIIDSRENEGKGSTVKKGVLAASGDDGIIMFLDADLAIPIEELRAFAEEIEQGRDIAIASRFVPGLRILEPVLWHRRIMERVFRLLRMLILNSWEVQDTQCGFKVFRREAAVRIFSAATIKRFAFDSEVIFIARKMGYSIKELPITLQNPRASTVRLFVDPFTMFFALFKIRVNDFKGVYRWGK